MRVLLRFGVGCCACFRSTKFFIALAAAVLATLTIGSSRNAFAATSVGCDDMNSGRFDFSTALKNSVWNDLHVFATGDQLVFNITRSGGTSSFFIGYSTTPGSAGTFIVTDVDTVSKTITYSVTDKLSLTQVLGNSSDADTAVISVSASCNGGKKVTTTTTPTDSTNLRSLQTNLTKSVANTTATNTANAIDGGIGVGFSDGGTPSSFGPSGGFINFDAPVPKSETASRAEEAFAALGYAGKDTAPNYHKAPPRLDREWSAWADIRGTGWKANDTSGSGNNLTGNQINLTAGLGRKLNSVTLVGVVVGYEYFKYNVASLNGSLKGDGETIGGYFSRRFGGDLRVDAALAWSTVNYNASSGTASGSFKGSRWLAVTGLTGNHKAGVYMLEPSAKLYMLWESQNAWTDSLGTAQASRTFSAGRTAVGSKIARSYAMSSDWTYSPYVGLYGDWRFQSDSAIPTGTQVGNIGSGLSGRVTAGLNATAANGMSLLFNSEYGGLDANYKIWSGNVRRTVPF